MHLQQNRRAGDANHWVSMSGLWLLERLCGLTVFIVVKDESWALANDTSTSTQNPKGHHPSSPALRHRSPSIPKNPNSETDAEAHNMNQASLGAPVVPFYPFSFWVPLLKPNSRKKGTLIIKGLLGNLAQHLARTLRP